MRGLGQIKQATTKFRNRLIPHPTVSITRPKPHFDITHRPVMASGEVKLPIDEFGGEVLKDFKRGNG